MENNKKELNPEEMDKVTAGEIVLSSGDSHGFQGVGDMVWDIGKGIYKKLFIPEKKLD